jgi:hypothetical protein
MKIKKLFELGKKTFELSDKPNRFYLAIVALLIFFAYLPTLQYEYVSHDQWRAFKYTMLGDESPLVKTRLCFNDRLPFDIRSGRFLGSVGECAEHSFVRKVSDFSKTRPIVLIIVILTAFCVGAALSPSMGGIVNATAIGALFVLSPGYASMFYNGMETVMTLIALILATLSYIYIRGAISEKIIKKKLILSALFFLTSCLIYPAWAFVVFIFALIDFLFCWEIEHGSRFRHLLIRFFFFAAIAAIYYLIVKLAIGFLQIDASGDVYEFSANFSAVYLCKKFFSAVLFYTDQPFLNAIYRPLFLMNFVVGLSGIVIYTVYFFKRRTGRFTSAVIPFLMTVLIFVFLTFVSMAPWLLSPMGSGPPNRVLVTLSLLMCALTGWIIHRVCAGLFPAKKYLSAILLIFIVLLPASAIQNKRTAIEVGIAGTEIEAMRLVVHKWLDENSFAKKRYIVVVKPERLMPFYYDRVLYDGNDNNIFNRVHYGGTLRSYSNRNNYFQMFTALLREKCDRVHPITLMNIHNLSFEPQKAEEMLDESPSNMVFTVIKQGEHIKTKHEVLEINFSLITNLPEPLIVER